MPLLSTSVGASLFIFNPIDNYYGRDKSHYSNEKCDKTHIIPTKNVIKHTLSELIDPLLRILAHSNAFQEGNI